MELLQKRVDELSPNGYNFNEMTESALKALAAEVRKRGYIMHHITARQDADALIIIDGEHQWKAAKMAGLEMVPVQMVNATEGEAIAETYRRNGLRGDANRVKLARAIQKMQGKMMEDGEPLSNVKAGKLLGRSDVWVKTTLQYAELADLAKKRKDFPEEAAIAKMTEKDVKAWLAFARDEGPNPLGGDDSKDGGEEGQGGENDAKDEDTADVKADKVVLGIIKKLSKMSVEDRAQVTAAVKRFDKADAKASAERLKAEPHLPFPDAKGK